MDYGDAKSNLNKGDDRYKKTITFMSNRLKGLINTIPAIFLGLPYK